MSQAIAQLRPGAALLPLYPQSFEETVCFARLAVIGGLIKPIKVGWGQNAETESHDATEARATMIIMQGMELGIPPMQSVQLLALINNRIVAHSEAVPGLLLSKGFKIDKSFTGTEMADDWTAVCVLTRPDGQKFTGTFSVKDAKQARLWSPAEKVKKSGRNGDYEADNDSAWHRFPKRMLWARALGFAAKDGAADVMRGLAVREEIEDLLRAERAIDVTPAAAPKTLDIPDDDVVTDEGVSPSHHADASEKPDTPSDASADQETEDEPIVDPELFVSQLEDAIALCDSAEELKEVADANAGAIKRLPKALRVKAAKLIKDRMDE